VANRRLWVKMGGCGGVRKVVDTNGRLWEKTGAGGVREVVGTNERLWWCREGVSANGRC
jgi:hypothetical protein